MKTIKKQKEESKKKFNCKILYDMILYEPKKGREETNERREERD